MTEWNGKPWLDSLSWQLVELFWEMYDGPAPYPRDLEQAVNAALPVTIIKLPRLRLHHAENWLSKQGKFFSFDCKSRALRGCLAAYGGEGFIFVDGTDPADEQRFTIAHEAGHFLADYWYPRRQAQARFGSDILEVMDGLRRATIQERLDALLNQTRIGFYSDLMEREQEGQINTAVWSIEDRADRLALTLLAPPEAVLAEADFSAPTFAGRKGALTRRLQEVFGLALSVAPSYSRLLLEATGHGPTWVETLKLG